MWYKFIVFSPCRFCLCQPKIFLAARSLCTNLFWDKYTISTSNFDRKNWDSNVARESTGSSPGLKELHIWHSSYNKRNILIIKYKIYFKLTQVLFLQGAVSNHQMAEIQGWSLSAEQIYIHNIDRLITICIVENQLLIHHNAYNN